MLGDIALQRENADPKLRQSELVTARRQQLRLVHRAYVQAGHGSRFA
jgi:hypothetical protein